MAIGLWEAAWGICPVCEWDDDGRDGYDEDDAEIGSLSEARARFATTGSSRERREASSRRDDIEERLKLTQARIIAECDPLVGESTPKEFLVALLRVSSMTAGRYDNWENPKGNSKRRNSRLVQSVREALERSLLAAQLAERKTSLVDTARDEPLATRRERLARYLGYPTVHVALRGIEESLKHRLPTITCPACGYFGLREVAGARCYVCHRTDDGQDDLGVIGNWQGKATLQRDRKSFVESGRAHVQWPIPGIMQARAIQVSEFIVSECGNLLTDVARREFVEAVVRIDEAMSRSDAAGEMDVTFRFRT